ncbi:ead/Ea22-like family protein [Atlantibacter subterranea]|uniref:Ead/Ea22-like family protein n=2 Tax=Enterobacteriaceae TaxID=543 RepID=A0A427V9P0_9ENTR|nr:ead/Ea22-like family protein [Atlantibacter subterranea]RSE08014.1 ead/Ea22-like family protein [Atlantibacter subterranea]RSE29469.1 ead/Ea22-like family protein [Atlantibacter subterranea]
MAMRQKARSASAGAWFKESGDGWEAVCSSDGQANGGFIIAHFEGPDAKANREFMQAANPNVVLALLDELERKDKEKSELKSYYEGVIADGSKRIAELEARTVTVKLPTTFWYEHDDLTRELAVLSKRQVKKALKEAFDAAGINLTVEG